MTNLKTAVCVLVVLAAGAACGVSLMPSKDAWYAQHYIIMQDFERQAYREMSETARAAFQAVFWESRDPASKAEFDKRMDYIRKTYKRDNSKQPFNCDRARIYLLNGRPAQIDMTQTDWTMSVSQGASRSGTATTDRSNEDISATTAEVWTYPFDKYFVKYSFAFKPPNEWRLIPTEFSGNRYIGALETQSKEQTYGILNPAAYAKKVEELKAVKDQK
jgi:GWxTD domain-containing protein